MKRVSYNDDVLYFEVNPWLILSLVVPKYRKILTEIFNIYLLMKELREFFSDVNL